MIYNIHELSWCWKFQNNPLYPHHKRKVISPHQYNIMSTKTVKNIREPLKKPRPLRSTSLESPKETLNTKARADLLAELEILNVRISNCDFDEIVTADIALMCSLLKKHGEELDSVHKDALDRFFSTLRNICREDRLDAVSRLKLLEVIEMRAMRWKTNENVTNYFTTKLSQLEEATERQNLSGSISPNTLLNTQNQNFSNASNVALAPGEILRSSGKFSKPTKIAGKNYFKDEIVIRNCDSGKVMGIKGRRVHMIEELSDTVISFQRVNAGARDRLVQITGPHEEAISHAKYLVEDTIKRNVSPVRDNLNISELTLDNKEVVDYGTSHFDRNVTSKRNLSHSYSMSDASSREFNVPVYVGNDVIMLSGTKTDLLKTAKTVLTQYFAYLEPSEKEVNSVFQPKTVSPNNNQRFALKKQASLKENLPSSFQPVDQSFSRQSSSSMSSSSDDILPDEESSELEALASAPIPPPSYPSRDYSREFLLECARYSVSKKKPPNYEHIAANFPEIIPQSPVMFDPSPFLQRQQMAFSS